MPTFVMQLNSSYRNAQFKSNSVDSIDVDLCYVQVVQKCECIKLSVGIF